jgi:hypothetical protein
VCILLVLLLYTYHDAQFREYKVEEQCLKTVWMDGMGWSGMEWNGMEHKSKVSVFSLIPAWLIIQDLSSCICLISFRCYGLFAVLGKRIFKFIIHMRQITSKPRTENVPNVNIC